MRADTVILSKVIDFVTGISITRKKCAKNMDSKRLTIILFVIISLDETLSANSNSITITRQPSKKPEMLTTVSPKKKTPKPLILTTPAEEPLGPFGFLPKEQEIIGTCAVVGVVVLVLLIICCACCEKSKTTYADMTKREIAAGMTPSMIDAGLTKSMVAPSTIPEPASRNIVMNSPVNPMMNPYGMVNPMIPPMLPPLIPPSPYYPPLVPSPVVNTTPGYGHSGRKNGVNLPPGVVLPKALKNVKPKNP